MAYLRTSHAAPAKAGELAAERRQSVTTRLLALSAGFIILTEALFFVPTIAAFRSDWMEERFDTAELAVLAARAPADSRAFSGEANELLKAADIRAVTVLMDGKREPLFGAPRAQTGPVIDLEAQTLGGGISGVGSTLFGRQDRDLTIVGRPRSNAAVKLEVVVPEVILREAIVRETAQVLFYSLLLALLIGTLVYAALADTFVRPMRRLTSAITRFRAAPQDASRNLVPSGRDDEIGEAEIAFADMQDTVRQAFLQRERLAQLGLAVSKIAHDLRHSLGAAQLVSERLASVDDPVVRVTAPRLERALERAVGLAQSTLQFGRAQESAPVPELLYLADAVEDAANEALLGLKGVTWTSAIASTLEVDMDPEHLHRILTNLIRNAGQAIVAAGKEGAIAATAEQHPNKVTLEISDMGPGLPKAVIDNLFVPFAGTGLSGGSGLGLAIARDLARLNGGDIVLIETGPKGTRFRLTIKTIEEEN